MLKAFILAMWLGVGADTGTSLQAFNYGAVEANPFMVSTRPAPFVAQVAAATAVETWLATEFNNKHPKLTKVLLAAHVGISIGVSIHNVHITQGLRSGR